jgi:hypothetical protein
MWKRSLIVCFALLTAAVACRSVQVAPAITATQVREALNLARYAGAEARSPYELYSAQLYYDQALVEEHNGNHELAQRYLARAYQQAMTAIDNAKKPRSAP